MVEKDNKGWQEDTFYKMPACVAAGETSSASAQTGFPAALQLSWLPAI